MRWLLFLFPLLFSSSLLANNSNLVSFGDCTYDFSLRTKNNISSSQCLSLISPILNGGSAVSDLNRIYRCKSNSNSIIHLMVIFLLLIATVRLFFLMVLLNLLE
ncbi:MAG: hypothetical protein ACRC9O_02235 [Plesiomonas sp.]|uniref:hypothetical protein n=1 Tax=Plesiomonas sp. TaxID=2486279 RepID=UPI003F2B1205